MKNHELKYKDDELIDASQASAIIGKNSGKSISPSNVAAIVRRNGRKPHQSFGRIYGYRYGDIKNIVVAPRPGRRPLRPGYTLSPSEKMARHRKKRAAAETTE